MKLTMLDLPTLDGGTRNSSCSGGLIAPQWVLTAGHCFKDVNEVKVSRTVARKTVATIGRADLDSKDGHDLTIVSVKQSKTEDVALAKLNKPVEDIVPMRLNRTKPKLGQTVTLAGYGLLNGADEKSPTRMQTGKFTISSVNSGLLGMSGKAPQNDTSPCPHDSGGPYFTEDENGDAIVFAVVSGGPTCPHTGADGSGRIDTVASWILGIIGHDGPKPEPSTVAPTPPAATPLAKPKPASAPMPYELAVPAGGLVAGAGVVAMLMSRRNRRRRRFRHRRY